MTYSLRRSLKTSSLLETERRGHKLSARELWGTWQFDSGTALSPRGVVKMREWKLGLSLQAFSYLWADEYYILQVILSEGRRRLCVIQRILMQWFHFFHQTHFRESLWSVCVNTSVEEISFQPLDGARALGIEAHVALLRLLSPPCPWPDL